MNGSSSTTSRKDSHLDVCAEGDVEPWQNRTLLECVELFHDALPELDANEVETRSSLFGRSLNLPFIITGMTGGTERAGEVNRDLAQVAEHFGVAFGVGSQRPMLESEAAARSYEVRNVAPKVVLVGNLGAWQAAALGVDGVLRLMDAIGGDGMAIHLNAAQELIQPEGDRHFRGGLRIIEALAKALGPRLLVKETGCGLSPSVVKRLADVGVQTFDVSGLGGTSWVRVEQLRASGVAAQVGETFSGWGIPTAAAVLGARRVVGPEVTVMASGGIRNGLEAAKAFALGADLVGMALPLFRAQQSGGIEAAAQTMEAIATGLRHALLLTGARNVSELRTRPRVITGMLKDWMTAL